MANYAKGQPLDNGNSPIQNAAAPFTALKSWNTSIAAGISSCINLNPNTTRLEIGTFGGQGAVIKWIPVTDVTSGSVVSSGASNFDNFVPAGTYRMFVVPRETVGTPINPNVQTGSIYGLYQRVAWISAGNTITSILANEY